MDSVVTQKDIEQGLRELGLPEEIRRADPFALFGVKKTS